MTDEAKAANEGPAQTTHVPDVVTHTDVNVVDELHDLLNRFSGMYHVDTSGGTVIQTNDIANQTVDRTAELLGVSNDQAVLFLIGHSDHKIVEANGTRTLTYDKAKLV